MMYLPCIQKGCEYAQDDDSGGTRCIAKQCCVWLSQKEIDELIKDIK